MQYNEFIIIICVSAINVQPGPARFVQLTTKYWEEFGDQRPGWLNLGYNLPPGCTLSTNASQCPEGFLLGNSQGDVAACQYCPDSDPWSYYEWILTMKPGVFGMPHGVANPTGVALMSVLTIMVVCSLPFVRRGGYFEVCFILPYFMMTQLHYLDCICLVEICQYNLYFKVSGI